ncbi:MAG: protein-arginine deiminase family protein, partial [Planctomycetota bacterium]
KIGDIAVAEYKSGSTMGTRWNGDHGGLVVERAVNILKIDLDVDSDRSGIVDEADDEDEDTWGREKGAIVLVNCDNDDGTGYAGIDNSTAGVDNDEDKKDLGQLVVAKLGPIPDTTGWSLKLRLENPGLGDDPLNQEPDPGSTDLRDPRNRIQIYWEHGAALELVGFNDGAYEKEFTGADFDEFVGYGQVDFWIEGLEHAAVVDIVVECTLNGNRVGDDRVRVMTAPLLFMSNIARASRIYVRSDTPLRQALDLLGADKVAPITLTGEERWPQDQWQFGISSAPISKTEQAVMPTAMEIPRGEWPLKDWGRSTFPSSVPHEAYDPSVLTGDASGLIGKGWDNWTSHPFIGESSAPYGGNIEVSPPVDNYPLGRLIVGSNLTDEFPSLGQFLRGQRLQTRHAGGSDYRLIELDVNWLHVGHVDEIMTFVPTGVLGGFGTLLAHPARAHDLIASAPADRAMFYTPGSLETNGLISALSADKKVLTVNIVPPALPAGVEWDYLRIYSGDGSGQVAKIASWVGNTITVSQVWYVPDMTTLQKYLAGVDAGGVDVLQLDYFMMAGTYAGSGFVAVTGTEFWRYRKSGAWATFPALTTAGEVAQDNDLWKANYVAADSIEHKVWRAPSGPREQFNEELGWFLNVKKVPVFYMCDYSAGVDSASAMCPNAINLQVYRAESDTYFTFIGAPLGPRLTPGTDETDVLRSDIFSTLLDLNCVPMFADTWDYHCRSGGPHCGTQVRRLPVVDEDEKFLEWWQEWKD